jgi:hypothetical protein
MSKSVRKRLLLEVAQFVSLFVVLWFLSDIDAPAAVRVVLMTIALWCVILVFRSLGLGPKQKNSEE